MGNTGNIPDASCTDCNGVVNGAAFIDSCGICSGDNTGIVINGCLTSIDFWKKNISFYPNPTTRFLYLGDEVKWSLSHAIGKKSIMVMEKLLI